MSEYPPRLLVPVSRRSIRARVPPRISERLSRARRHRQALILPTCSTERPFYYTVVVVVVDSKQTQCEILASAAVTTAAVSSPLDDGAESILSPPPPPASRPILLLSNATVAIKHRSRAPFRDDGERRQIEAVAPSPHCPALATLAPASFPSFAFAPVCPLARVLVATPYLTFSRFH